MERRRGSREWAATPVDDSDAAAAVAEVELWRKTLTRELPDFAAAMHRIRDRLAMLWLSPLVRGDPVCCLILEGMAACADIEAFEAEVARLRARVDEIVTARTVKRTPASVLSPVPGTSHAEPQREEPLRATAPGARAWRSALTL